MAEKVDMAILGAPARSPFIDYRQISEMSFPLVAAPDLFAMKPEAVSKAELERHPQMVAKSSDEKAPNTGLLEAAPKWFVNDMSTQKDLLLAGLGWGRLPDHMVEAEIARGDLVCLPTLGDLNLPICLTKRAGQVLGPVRRRIWEPL